MSVEQTPPANSAPLALPDYGALDSFDLQSFQVDEVDDLNLVSSNRPEALLAK